MQGTQLSRVRPFFQLLLSIPSRIPIGWSAASSASGRTKQAELGLEARTSSSPSPQARCTLSLDRAGLSPLICSLLSQGWAAHTFLPAFPSLLSSFLLFLFIFFLHSLYEDELLYKSTWGPPEKGSNGEGNDRQPQGEVDKLLWMKWNWERGI